MGFEEAKLKAKPEGRGSKGLRVLVEEEEEPSREEVEDDEETEGWRLS